MKTWSIVALILWATLMAYTGVVAWDYGLGLLPVFFGDIAKFGWPGQFNFDFMMMLFVSASWAAWRARFRPAGLAIGATAFFFGATFLLPYLAWLMHRHRGNMAEVLLGPDYPKES